MDKNALKKYALYAKKELLDAISLKLFQYGITENVTADENTIPMTSTKKEQRQLLLEQIKSDGYAKTVENMAYLLFIRLCMLRFIEVNKYFTSHIQPFTLSDITESADNFISSCKELEAVFSGSFKKLPIYTELIFPDNISDIVSHLYNSVPEDSFDTSSPSGQAEIIGWLYQFYMSPEHKKIIDPLHGKTISKDDIPVATQLFTTDWVVRYIIDNSLGRYWIERNPDSNLKNGLEYFIQTKNIQYINENITPQKMTVFDPCVGSGHFLVYAFDVLMKIYRECGYDDTEAVTQILEHNLYGLDIDSAVTELACFELMMKACQYDSSVLSRSIRPQIYKITDSSHLAKTHTSDEATALIRAFDNADEYGSLCIMPDIDMHIDAQLAPLADAARLLTQKYAIVVTNPPYLNKYSTRLKQFLNSNYKDYSGDLFSVFIYRNFSFCKDRGYCGFMTPNVWMFIKAHKKLREFIISNKSITTLVQPSKGAFFKEATVDVCAFVAKNRSENTTGVYIRLEEFKGGMALQGEKLLYALKNPDCGYIYEKPIEAFKKLPGMPFSFWLDEHLLNAFTHFKSLSEYAYTRNGMKTGNNDRFLRLWWEVDAENICFDADNYTDAITSEKKWFPYNKGGEYRKWYGNNDYVVNWKNSGYEIFKLAKQDERHVQDYPDELKFVPTLSWSLITSGRPAFRYKEHNLSDIAGMTLFADRDKILRYLGLLNSSAAYEILSSISPTINFQSGDIAKIPVPPQVNTNTEIVELVSECIDISKADWDAFETSSDFKKHPLLRGNSIKDAFDSWEKECAWRFDTLKANEERLDRIFAKLYDHDFPSCTEDKYISVRKADKTRDVKSLISYAVGVILGRYKSDTDIATANILTISDHDGLESDICLMFENFIKASYGEATLEENLSFIADALGGGECVHEVIRKYFLNNFYRDHCKTYRKRPVYWLLDSGKNNGFKCLIYMHSYNPEILEQILSELLVRRKEQIDKSIYELESKNGNHRQLMKLMTQKAELCLYEKKLLGVIGNKIYIDKDDGVKHNYTLFGDILAKIN